MGNSRDLNELHPAVKRRALAFISACDADGITLLITSTYRDFETQDALYAKGRTVRKWLADVDSASHRDMPLHQWRKLLDALQRCD